MRITHLGYQGGDANWIWKVDFAASLDGKEYAPIAGLQGLDFYHKWGPQEVNVPKLFEARFLRMRLHRDGQGVRAFHFPAELHVYSDVTEGVWAFPKTGPTLLEGKFTHTVSPRTSLRL